MDLLTRTLAKRIRRLRELQGLTQNALATKADVTAETVARLERPPNGRESTIYNPSLDTLHRLSVALAVDVADLLAPEADAAHGERELASLLLRASPITATRIRKIAEALLTPDTPEPSRESSVRRVSESSHSGRARATSNTYRIKTGRLVEVRVERSMRTKRDVKAWFNSVGAVFDTLASGTKAVVVADWRLLGFLSNDIAGYLRLRMTQTNDRVERSAALVSAGTEITSFQLSRLVRESKNENRRAFTQAKPLVAWLSEILSESERTRLIEFLAEVDGTS